MKFFKPDTTAQALKLKKNESGSHFIAGGTQINSLFSAGKKISALISLQKLNLCKIKKDSIGACASLEDIKTHPKVHKGLAEAASHLASRNVRNMATIGGNIASQQSSSDMLPVLVSLNAQIVLAQKNGRKELPLKNWIKSPGKNGDLILGFKLPDPDIKIFQKKYSRTKNDLPILKAAVGYFIKDGNIVRAYAAAGCMAPIVIYLEKTSSMLEGASIETLDAESLFETAKQEVKPIDDIRASALYRMKLLKAFLADFTENMKTTY